MSNAEKYLLLNPDGSMRWITTDRKNMLHNFREAIGCDLIEQVIVSFGFYMLVDECGKIKNPQQPINWLASRFYPGSLFGDVINGPVIFTSLSLIDGEYEWSPLTERDLAAISLITGKELPDK